MAVTVAVVMERRSAGSPTKTDGKRARDGADGATDGTMDVVPTKKRHLFDRILFH